MIALWELCTQFSCASATCTTNEWIIINFYYIEYYSHIHNTVLETVLFFKTPTYLWCSFSNYYRVTYTYHTCMLIHWVMSSYLQPLDCHWPSSSIHGILQERILEWVTISYYRDSSQLRDWTSISCISCIGRQILYHWDTWEAHQYCTIL